MIKMIDVNGFNIRIKDRPLAFSAVSSLFSDRFPRVIIDERSIARGRARGIKLAETKNNSSRITRIEIPFPIKSSIYIQKNCIIKINIDIANVTINGPKKDFKLK